MAGTLFAEIKRAAARLAGHARQTPLEHSPGLSALSGAEVWLKCEHLQVTGSFKFRGAYNCIAGLGDKARAGVIAASSGNHGMAVARAAGEAGVAATVCLPAYVSPLKKAAIEALGAAIHMVEGDALAAEIRARQMAVGQGLPFISPYNDLQVMAGQGTIGLEIAQADMAFDGLFAAVGGGGMIGGIGAVLSRGLPGCRLVGCWPEVAASLHHCIEAGHIITVDEGETLSDGTAGGVEEGTVTFDPCRRHIARHVLVSEAEIAAAMGLVAEHERWIIEGAAAVAVAALLKDAAIWSGKRVVIVLCGRNIAFEKFIRVVGDRLAGGARPGRRASA